MTYACDNPKCQYHVELNIHRYATTCRVAKPVAQVIPVSSSQKAPVTSLQVEEVRRFEYRNRYGDLFYLCESCHKAVSLVQGIGCN